MYLPKDLESVVNHFSNLPGIGPKSAHRLALYMLKLDKSVVEDFAQDLVSIKNNVKFCEYCFNLSDERICQICSDENRDKTKLLVVEDVLDLLAFERTEQYDGLYHVLGGLLSPMQGLGPEDIKVDPLIKRVKNMDSPIELIIATTPSLEGEATAMYVKDQLAGIQGLSVTRIARGVPTGADLDYTDKITLLRSLENRAEMSE